MAPSATQTTVEIASRPIKQLSHIGAYKDIATTSFDKETELKGKDGFASAKVRPL